MRPAAAAMTRAEKIAVYRDTNFRAAFKADMDRDSPTDNEARRIRPSFWRISIDDCKTQPHLNGVPLVDEAKRRGMHPVDLALDLAVETNLEARFHMPLFNDNEEGVRELLQSPAVLLGLSDAGAHVSQMYDTCYSTYLLGHWVRETGALTLPQAIRMLTSRPAEVFGLIGRGRLQVGNAADVTVFDPTTIACGEPERVHDLPAGADRLITRPSGVEAVIVNGTLIRRQGRDVIPDGALQPGRLIRRGRNS
jgi:N-acyl-D-aspartate/D-glutamate deacylase